jgi:hypothetical protein
MSKTAIEVTFSHGDENLSLHYAVAKIEQETLSPSSLPADGTGVRRKTELGRRSFASGAEPPPEWPDLP